MLSELKVGLQQENLKLLCKKTQKKTALFFYILLDMAESAVIFMRFLMLYIPPRQYHYPQNGAQTHHNAKTYMLRFMTKMFHCQMYADKTAAQRQ